MCVTSERLTVRPSSRSTACRSPLSGRTEACRVDYGPRPDLRSLARTQITPIRAAARSAQPPMPMTANRISETLTLCLHKQKRPSSMQDEGRPWCHLLLSRIRPANADRRDLSSAITGEPGHTSSGARRSLRDLTRSPRDLTGAEPPGWPAVSHHPTALWEVAPATCLRRRQCSWRDYSTRSKPVKRRQAWAVWSSTSASRAARRTASMPPRTESADAYIWLCPTTSPLAAFSTK